jgi:hypothetical protein
MTIHPIRRTSIFSASSEEASSPTIVSREIGHEQEAAPSPAWGRPSDLSVGGLGG